MATPPLNFASEQERQKWIIRNASYFTVIHRVNMRYERSEHPTLHAAEEAARAMVKNQPNTRYLIYAIDAEGRDTFVKVISD